MGDGNITGCVGLKAAIHIIIYGEPCHSSLFGIEVNRGACVGREIVT